MRLAALDIDIAGFGHGSALVGDAAASFRRLFFQMRGRFTLTGRMGGVEVSDTGRGFFETYRTR